VIARWITIEGTIDSRGRVTTLDEVTRAEVDALDTTMRFRHPESGATLLPQAESVRARTREPNACSGARRFDKVIAAACTRMEPSTRQPPSPRAPGPTAAPGLTPLPPEVRRPEPEPTSPWTGEGAPPPIPTGLDGGKTATGERGFLARYRKPIGAGLALAAAAGIAVVFWPRKAASAPSAGSALPAPRPAR